MMPDSLPKSVADDRGSLQEMAAILTVSLRAGQIMLENGANTSRVEEAVHRLGLGLGAERMEVLVTPSGIIASLMCGRDHRTRMQRITKSGVQLARLVGVLDLIASVEAGQVALPEVEARLESLERTPGIYGPGTTALAVGLACASFGVAFGGSLKEFGVIFVTAALAQSLRTALSRSRLGGFLTTAVVAGFASALAMFLSYLVGAGSYTIVASILLLVPGVLLVSSTADLFRGDALAGVARAANALLIIIAGSAGVWAVVLALGLKPDSLNIPGQSDLVLVALMGALAGAGFAVLCGVPRRYLSSAALVGLIGVLSRSVLETHLNGEFANLVTGLLVGLSAELLSRWHAAPYPLFAVPGYIPLVPGVVFIRGVLYFVTGDYLNGLSSLIQAQLVLLAVAIGIGVVPVLANRK